MQKESKNTSFRFSIQLSLGRAIGGSILGLLIMVWIFVLGVLVGRGVIPNPLEKGFFQKPPTEDSLQSPSVAQGNPKMETQELQPQPKLDFYEDLNKERAEIKGVIPKEPESARPSEELRSEGLKTETPEKVENGTREKAEEKKTPSRYVIQLASFKEEAQARLFIEQMNKKEIPCQLSTVNSNGVTWYRVRTGGFEDRASAQVFSLSLKEKHHLNPMVVALP
jgi:septal ring-binding cell division protein DamX